MPIKITKKLSIFLAVIMILISVPFSASAANNVDLNNNYLFRPMKSFALVAGQTYNLTFTPQYTAEYKIILHGVKNGGGRNINGWLYDSNDNLLVDGTENRTTYDYVNISYTLEKGKSYYYKVTGLLTTTACTIEVNFSSGESGLLDAENGLKARLTKVEYDNYSTQTLLDNLKLIIYDKDKQSFVWNYKDAGGNTTFNSADVIIDTSSCGACGTNTLTVHYLGYTAQCDFIINHDFSVFLSHTDASSKGQGYDLYKCSRCNETQKTNVVDFDGTVVSSSGTDMGIVNVNDFNLTAGGSVDIVRGKPCNLFAKANNGCSFAGWNINGKIVSMESNFSFLPTFDVKIEPVFIDNVSTLTFLFVDNFSNIISYQQVDDAKDVVIPPCPNYTGYISNGWSISDSEIHSSKTSQTIYANMEKDTAKTVNINATGFVLKCGGKQFSNVATVPYGAKVQAFCNGAKAILSNGKVLIYGNTYTFYAGSDIELSFSTQDVTPQPIAEILSSSKNDSSYKIEFLASRSMAGSNNCTFVSSGFLYGKNMEENDLKLENVGKMGSSENSGIVKVSVTQGSETDTQYILSYGISSQQGSACARAFLTYKDKDGNLKTNYSDMEKYNY